MEDLVNKKWPVCLTFCSISAVMLLPFMVVSYWSFDYIKKDAVDMFNNNLTRFTHNTSMESVSRQLEEIDVTFQIVSNQITKESMASFISPSPSTLDPILSTVVNSTFFFKRAIMMDNENNYNVYPPDMMDESFAIDQITHPYYAKKNRLIYAFLKKPPTADKHADYSATVGVNLYDDHSRKFGMVAFELDLDMMSETLRNVHVPFNGRFLVASRTGDIIMHPNTSEIFTRTVPLNWFEQVDEIEGDFYDLQTDKHIFYHAFSKPEWVAFTIVDADEYSAFVNRAPQSLLTIFIICLILYTVIFCLCRVYFRQIITRIYLGVSGVNVGKEYQSLSNVYNKIKANRQQLEEAQRISSVDALMGISTRRMLDEKLAEIIKTESPFHLAIIDLDNFKTINDCFGHSVGDQVLKYVAQVGKGMLEPGSQLYRYGGEELVVIFTEGAFDSCFTMLDAWRHVVSQRQWREKDLLVTFSGGIARWQPGFSASDIIEHADRYLYQAKHSGKNTIQGAAHAE